MAAYDRNVLLFLVKTVQLGDKLCLDPYGGSIRDGTNVGLWSGCRVKKRQLIFPGASNVIFVYWNLVETFNTLRKPNIYKMFSRCPGRLMIVLCIFNLLFVSRGKMVEKIYFAPVRVYNNH